LNKLKKLKLESLEIDQECIQEFDGIMEIIKKLPKLKKLNGESKEILKKQIERNKNFD